MPDQRDWASILLRHGYAGLKKIGEGSFGVAVLVQDSEGHKAVCKLVDVSRASPKECQEARREGRLLAQLKHPYIVRYRENFSDRGWLGIIMDFCDGGDLTAQIKDTANRQDILEEDQILQWFTQSMLALKYLHSKHVLHRDLKPSNIFLSSAGHVRLGDFGISKVMNCTSAYAKTFVGTPYYLSPEVITEKPYAWPADVWSMGCILFHLCALKVPFDATNISQLAQKICNGRIPSIPQPYSAALRQLCLEMMTKKASSRPSCDDVINKPLIQDVVRALLAEATRPQQPTKAKHEIMDQFHQFDRNADGVIDRRELSMVLKHLDAEVWTDKTIDELLHVVDRNKDGHIQLDEFLLWAFGGDKQLGLAARADETMQLAREAGSNGDVDRLCQILVDWRQAVDVGCLRVSPAEVSAKACGAIAWLASTCRRALEEHQDTPTSYKLVRQLRAILLAVEQLLDECGRRRVERVAGIASRGALRGCCLELADGVRRGQCPGGLSDSAMEPMGVRWERLAEGERILVVKGFAATASRASHRRPSPEPLPRHGSRRASSRASSPQPDEGKLEEPLSACVTFCTSHGREFEFGAKTGRGDAFSFEAPDGAEIEAVRFADRTCVEVKTAPIPVSWSKRKIDEVRQSFERATEAVWSVLLCLSFRLGPRQGKFALLEAKRLGVADLSAVPPRVEDPLVGQCRGLKPPSHWRLALHRSAGKDGELGPDVEVAQVQLEEEELAKLQGVLTTSFARPPTAPAEEVDRLVPRGVELVRASRLQNWQAWVRFSVRREEVRAQLAALRAQAASVEAAAVVQVEAEPASDAEPTAAGEVTSAADAMAAGEGLLLKSAHLEELLGIQLDSETRGAWLLHGVTAQAAEGIARPDFDIAQAGPENGRLYGRGCYFSEWSDQIDKLCRDQNADGLRCMLLCRVTLGHVLTEEAVLPDVLHLLEQCTSGPYHSVLGHRGLDSAGATRDFVVYDKDQVYPEFLLWYRRVYR